MPLRDGCESSQLSQAKPVRNYVSGILAKLQVADRAEARLVARAAGIGTADESP
jgi:DNA-binding NarL/FixJ family response regulator